VAELYLFKNDMLVNEVERKESRHGCDHFRRTFRQPCCGCGQALSLFAANYGIWTP